MQFTWCGGKTVLNFSESPLPTCLPKVFCTWNHRVAVPGWNKLMGHIYRRMDWGSRGGELYLKLHRQRPSSLL